jgi:hypothetical protein
VCGKKKKGEISAMLKERRILLDSEEKALEGCPSKINAVAQWMTTLVANAHQDDLFRAPQQTTVLVVQSTAHRFECVTF